MTKQPVLKLLTAITAFVLVSFLGGSSAQATTIQDSPYVPSGFSYKWGDEFNGDNIDRTKWNYWNKVDGSNYQTSSDYLFQRDGILHMIPRSNRNGWVKVPIPLATMSADNQMAKDVDVQTAFKYGYFEIRMKARLNSGSWPAFWMKSNTSLPDRQTHSWYAETDMMEACGNLTCGGGDQTSTKIKWGANDADCKSSCEYRAASRGQIANTSTGGANGDEWVTYGFLWTPDTMESYVNGKLLTKISLRDDEAFDKHVTVGRYDKYAGMSAFRDPAYFILDSVVYAEHFDSSKLPFDTQFDYVRVYQKPGEGDIYNEPHITATSLKPGIVSEPYNDVIANTSQPIKDNHFIITSGKLPDGLALDEKTGAISGIPAKSGQFRFIVNIANDQFPGKSDSKSLTITINANHDGGDARGNQAIIPTAPNTGA